MDNLEQRIETPKSFFKNFWCKLLQGTASLTASIMIGSGCTEGEDPLHEGAIDITRPSSYSGFGELHPRITYNDYHEWTGGDNIWAMQSGSRVDYNVSLEPNSVYSCTIASVTKGDPRDSFSLLLNGELIRKEALFRNCSEAYTVPVYCKSHFWGLTSSNKINTLSIFVDYSANGLDIYNIFLRNDGPKP